MTSDEQWRDLDARLRAVEDAMADAASLPAVRPGSGLAASSENAPEQDTDQDTFWILSGLRNRLTSARGGIAFAGSVHTAAGPVEWQCGRTTEDLVEADQPTQEATADRLAALGHPVRLRLLLAVVAGQTSAADLADLDGIGTLGQVYHHIRTLTAAGWLASVRRGRLQVPAERVVPLLVAVAAAR